MLDFEQRFLPDSVRRLLGGMYSDLNRQQDDVYLTGYYQGIAVEGDYLIILKGLDKLDNHLSYAFNEIESFDHEIVTSFVVPLVHNVALCLSSIFSRFVK